MVESPTLYRSVDSLTFNNYARGIVWFRSPRYFRKLAKENKKADSQDVRADSLEGKGSYRVGDGPCVHDVSDDDGSAVHPAFLPSFSEVPLLEKYGAYVLKFARPLELREHIEQELLRGTDIIKVELRKIEYSKTEQLEAHPSPTEDWNRKYFSKPEKFAREKEWRLLILFRHSFPILNDTLKLRLSDLRRFYQYFNGQTDS